MNGTRGYSNYRGRGSLWKILAGIVLVIIILASVGFVYLQENVVYDGTGSSHLELPWEEEAPPEEEIDQRPLPELTIEEAEPVPEVPQGPQWESLHAYSIPAMPLTQADAAMAQTQFDHGMDSLMVTLKDSTGWVYFKTDSVLSTSYKAAADTAQALTEVTSLPRHSIARIYCFQDHRGGNRNVQRLGLTTTAGRLYQDGDRLAWMDPAKERAREYLCDLARDAAELGFDELLLCGVSYPTTGSLDKIRYGDAPKEETLASFLEQMRSTLEPYSMVLSLEVPKGLLTGEDVSATGLTLEGITPWVDRIYAAVEPEEIPACDAAVAALREGTIPFIPELRAVPETAPERFLLLSE